MDPKKQEDKDKVELHNDVEEGHDPKNAEKNSVNSVDKAEDAGPNAKKRKGDKSDGDKTADKVDAQKGMTKSATVRELYSKLKEMSKEDLDTLHSALVVEDLDIEDIDIEVSTEDKVSYDFTEDLNALVDSEATLSEDFKDKTAVIFESAIKSKLADEVNRLEESYNEKVEEAINEQTEELIEKVDSYLDYIIEKWMEENELAIETGLRTEIAENFMVGMKELFTESYIEVPESKVDLVDQLSEEKEELESEMNRMVEAQIEMSEQLETFKREEVIREASNDLAATQVEKLKSLVEHLEFNDSEEFAKKVATVKESYFNKKENLEGLIEEDLDENEEKEVSSNMQNYLTALRKI